jgi:hypothetical protein
LARKFLKNGTKAIRKDAKGGAEMTPKMKKWRESFRNGAKGAEMTRKGRNGVKGTEIARKPKEIAKKVYRCN